MNCGKCGTELPEESLFCPECGEGVAGVSKAAESTAAESIAAEHAALRLKNKKRLRIVLICVGAVIALLIALGIVLTVRYQAAMTLFNQGEYALAQDAFDQLGIFSNARAMARESRYQRASQLLSTGYYKQASGIFVELGNYKDSPDRFIECEKFTNYYIAINYMENHQMYSAIELFTELGDFLESRQKNEECKKIQQYDTGMDLLNSGELEAAKEAFTQAGVYSDAMYQVMLCANRIDYKKAGQAFADGKFYTAYKIYYSLGPYEDAIERSEACVQDVPAAGELYHNEAYRSRSCYLDIIAPKDEFLAYIKIYTENGELVSIAFIPPGKTVRVYFPAGNYKVNLAQGLNWFGEQDIFGEEGLYEALKFKDGEECIKFPPHTMSSIELRYGGGDGNLGSDKIDLNNL